MSPEELSRLTPASRSGVLSDLADRADELAAAGALDHSMQLRKEVVALGGSAFASLDSLDQARILRVGIQRAAWLVQVEERELGLGAYDDIIALGAPLFADLSATAKCHVLIAMNESAELLTGEAHHEAASDRLQQVLALGPHFHSLDDDGKGQWVRAMGLAADYGTRQSAESGLRCHEVVSRVCEPLFAEIDAAGKRSVLRARLNAGVIRYQAGDRLNAEREFLRLLGMGEPSFAELNEHGRECVLHACRNLGEIRFEQRRISEALSFYDQAARLGVGHFSSGLNLSGRRTVLQSHFAAAEICRLQGDSKGQLARRLDAAKLGQQGFRELDPESISEILEAGCDAADLLLLANEPSLALSSLENVSTKADNMFSALNLKGRLQALRSHDSAGNIRSDMGATDAALAEYDRVAQLGEPFFGQLNTEGRAAVLASRYTSALRWQERGQAAEALSAYLTVATLGSSVFGSLSADGRVQVLMALYNAARLHFAEKSALALRIRVLVLHRFVEDMQFGSPGPARGWRSLAEEGFRLVTLRDALDAARWWLAEAGAYPARASSPKQREQVLALAQAVALVDGARHRTRARKWTKALAEAKPLQADLAAWAAALLVASLDSQGDVDWPGGFMLALARSASKDASGWPESAPWREDLALLRGVLQFDSLPIAPGEEREIKPYRFVARLAHPRFQLSAFRGCAYRAGGPLSEALSAWRLGDERRVVQLLESGWHALGPPVGDLARVTGWLERFDVPDAGSAATDGLIFGDVERVLKSAIAAWIERRARDTAGRIPFEALLGIVEDSAGTARSRRHAVLRKLHDFVNSPCDLNLHARWTTLELGRFALAGASVEASPPPGSVSFATVEESADALLLEAYQQEQAELGWRLDGLQAKRPLPMPDPVTDDLTFRLFDVLAAQCRRLGHMLQVPGVEACSRRLNEGESLGQIWFDGSGKAHLLLLRSPTYDPILSDTELPADADWVNWHPLLAAFAESHRLCSLDSATHASNEARKCRREASMDAAQAAWERFVAPDSPATALILALRATVCIGRDVPRRLAGVRLILPAQLMQLPWLARAITGTTDAPDFDSGSLVLEASVSAWYASADAASATDDVAGSVVYTEEPMRMEEHLLPFGRWEASMAARALRCAARPADSGIDLASALQSPGPTHLVVHGDYRPFEPLSSRLSLTGADRGLPAWVMLDVAVRGDISLAACESMLAGIGVDEERWIGPVGIGPLLRARGARTVLGPLGKSHAMVSLLFYSKWFEARRGEPSAARALTAAQRALRDMTRADVAASVEALIEMPFRSAVLAHLNEMTDGQGDFPFRHPAYWTGFALIGDAPGIGKKQRSLRSILLQRLARLVKR